MNENFTYNFESDTIIQFWTYKSFNYVLIVYVFYKCDGTLIGIKEETIS